MEATELVYSVEAWRGIAERLRSGRVRFSTGHQCRTAAALGEWIEDAVRGAVGNVGLTLDWDSALSVLQAA